MRHKYETRGIVLARTSLGEASALVTLLTPDLGLLRARAQSVRWSGAKLSAALTTFAESRLVLVHGREGWRVAGAVLEVNWFQKIAHAKARTVAARVSGLLVRLVGGETSDSRLFGVVRGFFEALETLTEDTHEAAETLAALRVLAALGLDAGDIPGAASEFTLPVLDEVRREHSRYIARINNGIAASGL
ncbi:MAG: recombination protein O N-terminal domain-containing protein [Candidatus Paceibacterota bacterium]|jgi:DNA repair protein RecO (recombination protein O)